MSELESKLGRHLAPVSAPDELWERVCERRAPRRRELYMPMWAAALVLLSLGGGSLAAWRGGVSAPEQRPAQELQLKPVTDYLSRNLQKSEDCHFCHTI
jgi:hypothetical protein